MPNGVWILMTPSIALYSIWIKTRCDDCYSLLKTDELGEMGPGLHPTPVPAIPVFVIPVPAILSLPLLPSHPFIFSKISSILTENHKQVLSLPS
jgi:hypothetical protein